MQSASLDLPDDFGLRSLPALPVLPFLAGVGGGGGFTQRPLIDRWAPRSPVAEHHHDHDHEIPMVQRPLIDRWAPRPPVVNNDDDEAFMTGRAPMMAPAHASVPVIPDPPAPIPREADQNGQVVLDTTAMVYDRVMAYYDVLATEESSKRRLFTRHAAANQPKGTGAKGLSGDKKVEKLRHLLEHGFSDDRGRPIVRSKEQRELHETYIKTCLAKLYQDEWEDNRERILHQFGIEEFQQETLVIMPRRAGKTWSMAMFCAAMLLVCPDIEISVFATGQRIAGKLLKLISKMIRRLIMYVGVDEFKWVQENEQIITLECTSDNTKRQCGCYPGSARVRDVSVCV